LLAVASDSAPETRISRVKTRAKPLMTRGMKPTWYRMAIRAEKKMMVGNP